MGYMRGATNAVRGYETTYKQQDEGFVHCTTAWPGSAGATGGQIGCALVN